MATYEDHSRTFKVGDLVTAAHSGSGVVVEENRLGSLSYLVEFKLRRWVLVADDERHGEVWALDRVQRFWFSNFQLRPASLLDQIAYNAV